MKAVKQTVRHYYKYQYESWTQPVATGNTTAIAGGNMVISANSEYNSTYLAFNAFNGSSSGNWLTADGFSSGWWQITFPYKIKITALTYYNQTSAWQYTPKNIRFYTSSDLTTPIGDQFTVVNSLGSTNIVLNIPSGGVVADTIYMKIFDRQGSYGLGMNNLVIEATKQTKQESTSSDYDFYEDIDEYKVPVINNTYYGVNQ